MPWVRIDENALDHPKIGGLSDGAFRLWVEGLAHSQRFLTDGFLATASVRTFRHYSPKRRAMIVEHQLWDECQGGVQVHDYLAWNDSKEQVLFARECTKRRVALLRDPELRAAIRARDGDECRYCGRLVRWNDRKGDLGGTYDHVDPMVGNTLENLVVACRGCNSAKGRRTPESARKILLPEPVRPRFGSRSDLDQIKPATSGVECSSSSSGSEVKERGVGKTAPERASAFVEWYEDTHQRLFGIGYMGTNTDWGKTLEMVAKFTDSDMRDGALVWFGQDDEFASRGTRTIAKFASRITGCLQTIHARGIA